MSDPSERQRVALRKSLTSLATTIVILLAILFIPAGTLAWPQGWGFVASFLVAMAIAIPVLWRTNPEIFVARSKVQAGTKAWDYVFLTLILGALAVMPPVAAFDFRFGWSQLPPWIVVGGHLLFFAGVALQLWPQAVNRHFEPGVRIQSDRGHRVVDTGPYAIVRHPGYISGSLVAIAVALTLGSLAALLPAAIAVAALALRTVAEERLLEAELDGYAAYMTRVRYRWIPGVW